MTKESSIRFVASEVIATLDGRKTQARRIAKVTSKGCKEGFITPVAGFVPRSIENHISYCPYGEPGDRLWVRETFSYHEIPEGEPFYYPADRLRECVDHDYGFHYWADGQPEFGNWSKPKPSIHMHRYASRILLEVTNVRIERLNDISKEDAIAEGLKAITKDGKTIKYGIPDRDGYPGNDDHGLNWCDWNVSPVLAYKRLWESINGNGSWDLNQFCWVIEFKVISK